MPSSPFDPYPPAAFHFRVMFATTGGDVDASFQEVSGISTELDTESVPEGGENRFVHTLPKGVKHPHLELKRGIASLSSPLVSWCRSVFEGEFIVPIRPQSLMVQLLDEMHIPIRIWSFANAYPVKWEIEGFGSTKNQVAIEKIVLSYTYANRME
ncbi:phage tail protein [Pandoraea norimbergensis]|uniref:Phage tail protein n=1 Tax=Pandoraea norimbergensis TaxID=93219 RepID=A0ABN4JPI4_9BURK|nr:phage tail protein [Pandoraea norimbergensis]ALS61695.1 phage tail protein [Pandoraea norimbergensis]